LECFASFTLQLYPFFLTDIIILLFFFQTCPEKIFYLLFLTIIYLKQILVLFLVHIIILFYYNVS